MQLVPKAHVGTPPVEVVRDLFARLKKAGQDGRRLRGYRKRCYRFALQVHRENRQLCIDFRL